MVQPTLGICYNSASQDVEGQITLSASWPLLALILLLILALVICMLCLTTLPIIGQSILNTTYSGYNAPPISTWLSSLAGYSIIVAAELVLRLIIFMTCDVKINSDFIQYLAVIGIVAAGPALGVVITQQEQSMDVKHAVLASLLGFAITLGGLFAIGFAACMLTGCFAYGITVKSHNIA